MLDPQPRRVRIAIGLAFLASDRAGFDPGCGACHSPTKRQRGVCRVASCSATTEAHRVRTGARLMVTVGMSRIMGKSASAHKVRAMLPVNCHMPTFYGHGSAGTCHAVGA